MEFVLPVVGTMLLVAVLYNLCRLLFPAFDRRERELDEQEENTLLELKALFTGAEPEKKD